MNLSAGTRLGPYEILAPIGKGGMGEVWKARDTKLGRDVALKILPTAFASDPDRMARFEREARVLASLDHPNIAAIYGLEESDGVRALVLALIDGPTLADRIAAGPIPLDEAIQVARQIAEAIEYAHDRGVIHRDLKPANIKITSGGMVKVLDFGLAKALDDEPVPGSGTNSPTLTMGATRAGVLLGTAAYMSPEQAKGKQADRRSDVWSFGVVLYEMATSKPPFSGETVSDILASVIKEEPKLDAVPAELSGLVARCLNKDPRQRLQAIGEARIALENPKTRPGNISAMARHNQPWHWIGIATAAILGFIGLAVIHFRQSPPQRQHIRFQVAPPEGILSLFALSPDGHYLAFVTHEGVANKIWIRALDHVETRLLTSFSDTNANPFWSNDGEYLVFSAGGKLHKIPRVGGPTTVLCDLPGPLLGGSWRNDGTILFSANGVLYRVSSAGGSPVRVADVNGRFPVWLSGAKYLVPTQDGMMAGSLETNKYSKLLPDLSSVAFVPAAGPDFAAHLLFRRGDTLMAQPIDGDKAELRGEAFAVADHVGTLGGAFRGSFSASATGVLAYSSGDLPDRELVWIDRSGKRLQTVSRTFALAINPAIRLSPDDTRAIVPVSGGGNPDLWITDLNRSTFSRFTFDGSYSGLWSPDGRKVLWAAMDGKRYLRSADGSGKDELLFQNPSCGTCYPEDWSADGKRIAFTEATPKTQYDIWLVNTEGDRKPYPYAESRFNETWTRISPDGHWLAYVTDQPGQQEIMVESIQPGRGRWQISTQGGEWPEWRRDGRELFYRQGTKMMAVPMRLSETTVEAGKPEPLFDVPADTRFQVSRDGQRFLIAVPTAGAVAVPQLTVDTDWEAELKK